MALLRTLALKKLYSSNSAVIFNAVRQAGTHWIQDVLPADLPKTEEERKAAAAKYGLLPHEYETYNPNTFEAVGDYPKLPVISADQRDPFYPWDYPEYKKNFNEVWHEDWDMYTEDRYDNIYEYRTPKRKMLTYLFAVLFGTAGFTYLADPYPVHRPACAEHHLYEGRTHYSFERGHN